LYTATLSVITRAGCVDRDTVRIRVEEFTGSRLGVTVPGTSCVDTPLDLTVSAPGLTVSYDYGNSVISEEPVSVPYRTEGIYLLTVTGRDQNGCRTDTSTLIEIFPPLDVHIIPDSATVEVELGDQLELGFMTVPDRPLAGIDWEGMDSLVTLMSRFTPLVLPTQDVLYRLSVTDDYGCRATDSLLVRVATNYDDRIFVPNIFSPNGDARNDRFGVQAKPNTVAEIPYLRVLSRWGGLVYECQNCPLDDPMQGWDGTIDGKVAPMGVYVWIAEIVFSDGGIRQFRGDVMLLR
jgi:gliding motility-associated-like protein